MSTLLLNGLMPERQETFIRTLGRHHTVTGTRLTSFQSDPQVRFLPYNPDTLLAGSLLGREIQDRQGDECRELAASLAADIVHSPLGPESGWKLDDALVHELVRPKVAAMLLDEARFRVFLEENPVDMVISGSDYSSHSRVIARTARAMGLPTLNLEHGFFFTRTAPDHVRTHGWMPAFFSSEYVNLDNALEVELLAAEQALFTQQKTNFLALGTPISTVADQTLPRSEAAAALGLDGGKTIVAVMGSWQEGRNVQKLVADQVETIALYEDLFTTLAASPLSTQIALVIKLHPADQRPDVLPGVVAGFQALAERCGLARPLITADKLPEVLSAADVIVTTGFSSVQYDAFLLGKISIALFPPSVKRRVKDSWFTAGTLPLKHGVSRSTTDGQKVWEWVGELQDPAGQQPFHESCRQFSERYDLRHQSVEEKSAAILEWISGQLG